MTKINSTFGSSDDGTSIEFQIDVTKAVEANTEA
jgi:hypothetical protein